MGTLSTGNSGSDQSKPHPVDQLIRTSREQPSLIGAAVTGWLFAVSFLGAYYIETIGSLAPAAPFWFYVAAWFVAGLVTGRFWTLLLAFLPALVMGALGTTPMDGSNDMSQWALALVWGVAFLVPATLIGVIVHQGVAGFRGT